MNPLLSGGVAAFSSVIILQPLDVIKTRLQEKSSPSSQATSLRSLWRGTTPTLIRNVPGVAVYFTLLSHFQYLLLVANHRHPTNPLLRPLLDPNDHDRPSPLGNIVLGSSARALAGLTFMPFTLLKVRLESRSFYRGGHWWDGMAEVVRREGIRGLWRGGWITTLRDAPHAALYLPFYRWLQTTLGGPDPTMAQNASAAGIAGVMATVITQPLDVIKTRVQLSKGRAGRWSGVVGEMVGEGGFGSLFSGMIPRMMRKSLSSAITWAVYEKLNH